MTLDEIVNQCLEDSVDWFPTKATDVPFLTLALCGEAGELANLIKKIERGSCRYVDVADKVQGELTDVFVYLMNLAGVLNIDLVESYKTVRAANVERFGNVAA